MATPKRSYSYDLQQQQHPNVQQVKNSGMISSDQSPRIDDKEEEMSRSALAMFRAKEEEIERRKMEVRDKVHAHLGRVETETKRLAEIREVSPTIYTDFSATKFIWFSFYVLYLRCVSVNSFNHK